MKYMKNFLGEREISRVALGCMRIGDMTEKQADEHIQNAIAWLLRLPEKMQPVVGTTNLQRVREIAEAADIEMSAEDWYRIYTSAGYQLP